MNTDTIDQYHKLVLFLGYMACAFLAFISVMLCLIHFTLKEWKRSRNNILKK